MREIKSLTWEIIIHYEWGVGKISDTWRQRFKSEKANLVQDIQRQCKSQQDTLFFFEEILSIVRRST